MSAIENFPARRPRQRPAALSHLRQRRRRQEHADRPPALRQQDDSRRHPARHRAHLGKTRPGSVDLSLLTDGLQAEREQGITIDVAYRYFTTGTRKYIIADAPGHEQYTRNMVTAASTADLAIILIDARKGVLTQTRRHSYLAHLLGIPHLVVAVNKMDLVDYSPANLRAHPPTTWPFAELGITDVRFIPMSALNGDMIVERGERLDWYDGPTLLECSKRRRHPQRPPRKFRFPVQYVCRPQDSANPELHDYRGFMGRVESGELASATRSRCCPPAGNPRQGHPGARRVAAAGRSPNSR
jgi:sulfate adenylyltransferase subunit 1 (EFTu-like GTPase family)